MKIEEVDAFLTEHRGMIEHAHDELASVAAGFDELSTKLGDVITRLERLEAAQARHHAADNDE